MKKMIFLICLSTASAFGAEPSTTCPTGYYTISSDGATKIATTCPSGYYSVGTAKSCLSDDYFGGCFMYAPVGISFTDDTGTYEYTDVCPMS